MIIRSTVVLVAAAISGATPACAEPAGSAGRAAASHFLSGCVVSAVSRTTPEQVATQLGLKRVDKPVGLPNSEVQPLVWQVPSQEGRVYLHQGGGADCAVTVFGAPASTVEPEVQKMLTADGSPFVKDGSQPIAGGVATMTSYLPRGRSSLGAVLIHSASAHGNMPAVHVAVAKVR